MEPGEIRRHEAFQPPWYYSLELAPGTFTQGRDHLSVAQTRELLRHVDVESGGIDGAGAHCLDVGTQEGLVAILLERRGGSEVVAYDRILRRARLDLVKRALDTHFEPVGDIKLQDLPERLNRMGRSPFDVVVFSGVLYHMFDPLAGLAVVRGFVREGGICVIETAVAHENSHAMHFNSAGRFNPYDLWYVTPRCLDYLLRFLHLKPIDAVTITGGGGPGRGYVHRSLGAVRRALRASRGERVVQPPQGRIAVACRATSGPVAERGDEWIYAEPYRLDFEEFLDWDAVAGDAPPVGYEQPRRDLVRREDGSVDVHATVTAIEPLRVDPAEARLALDARF